MDSAQFFKFGFGTLPVATADMVISLTSTLFLMTREKSFKHKLKRFWDSYDRQRCHLRTWPFYYSSLSFVLAVSTELPARQSATTTHCCLPGVTEIHRRSKASKYLNRDPKVPFKSPCPTGRKYLSSIIALYIRSYRATQS